MRTSPVHYIAPSAISIVPNCNGSANDVAVHIATGTKIKVWSPALGIGTVNAMWQEWTLRGRNRRLAYSDSPYTIFARLSKSDPANGYLVFAKQMLLGTIMSGTSRIEVWVDKHSSVTVDGLSVVYRDHGSDVINGDTDYWYIRLGEVSKPNGGSRTISIDTGILGTDRFNAEFELNPDKLPRRVELDCTIDNKTQGQTPYVAWGKTLLMSARLIEGWSENLSDSVYRWTITRNTGNTEADAAWNYPEPEKSDDDHTEEDPSGSDSPAESPAPYDAHIMDSGRITLPHLHMEGGDVFEGAMAATFTVTAWGVPEESDIPDIADMVDETTPDESDETTPDESDEKGEEEEPELVMLAYTDITIFSETVERYELVLSDAVVSYSPQTRAYTPADGVRVGIRTIDQKGDVFEVVRSLVTALNIAIQYATVGGEAWTSLDYEGAITDTAATTLPIDAFADGKSVNIRLIRNISSEDGEEGGETPIEDTPSEESSTFDDIATDGGDTTPENDSVEGGSDEGGNTTVVELDKRTIAFVRYAENGKNAVRIDLDNQADIIACREDGTVRFTRIVTVHASIYDGASPATAGVSTTQTVADMAIAGVTPTTFTLVNGLLTVAWQFVAGTVLASGSYAKDITLNYNGETYTAQFSLTSSNTSAVYQLHPNMSAVNFHVDANGNYIPSSQDVYCGYTKTDGGGTQTFPGNNIANLWREGGAPYNIFWRRQLSDGTFSEWHWTKDLPSGVRSIDSTTTDIGIEFAMSSASSFSLLSDQNIIDRELVPIVKDGKNGPKGDDAQEVNPNILLRTVFDRGMDFVLEAWHRSSNTNVFIDTAADTIVNGRKSIRLNAMANEDYVNFSQSLLGKLKANTWYTLSFNAFVANGGGSLILSFYNLFSGVRTNIFGNDRKVILDGAEYQVAADGNNDIRISGGWDGARHTITFLTNSSISTEALNIQFYQAYSSSGTGNHSMSCICMPKLEEGRTATAYMAHESDLKGDNAPYNVHAYAISRSRTSHANGDLYQVNGVRWFPSAPDPRATHPYVWERIMHYTAAGVNDQTSYICLTGAVGAMGKLCYMAGEYRDDVEYTSNDSQTVAVEVSGTSETTSIYYLNAESNVVDGRHIGPTTTGQTIWVLGMSQYNLVRARYLFADFAQFGAAVVSGDWLISVHGTINGTAYEGKYTNPATYTNGSKTKPTYFWFDPAYPNEDHAGKYKTPGSSSSGQWASDHHNFIPNYAVNLLAGKTYQNDAYVRGEVHATSGVFEGIVRAKNFYQKWQEPDYSIVDGQRRYYIDLSFGTGIVLAASGNSPYYLPDALENDSVEILLGHFVDRVSRLWDGPPVVYASGDDKIYVNTAQGGTQDVGIAHFVKGIRVPVNRLFRLHSVLGKWIYDGDETDVEFYQ